MLKKVGFGGSCHWCTEAVFDALRGVDHVEQGWIRSTAPNDEWSEAVIVHFDASIIDLGTLLTIHLYTHSCTSTHPMRQKYRSAVYTYNAQQNAIAEQQLKQLQAEFEHPIITRVLPFVDFKLNDEKYLDYYKKNPDKPFCQLYINPKLQRIREQFNTNCKTK